MSLIINNLYLQFLEDKVKGWHSKESPFFLKPKPKPNLNLNNYYMLETHVEWLYTSQSTTV